MDEHCYQVTVEWTGNTGEGTYSYGAYSRDHTITVDGKPPLLASSDPQFRGDPSRHNPEDLLVASLSSCHMLWYLHLCTVEGVDVVSYVDHAEGRMTVEREGGRFNEVVLRPRVRVRDAAMIQPATTLHERAHRACFVAASVNFPVRHAPDVSAANGHLTAQGEE